MCPAIVVALVGLVVSCVVGVMVGCGITEIGAVVVVGDVDVDMC